MEIPVFEYLHDQAERSLAQSVWRSLAKWAIDQTIEDLSRVPAATGVKERWELVADAYRQGCEHYVLEELAQGFLDYGSGIWGFVPANYLSAARAMHFLARGLPEDALNHAWPVRGSVQARAIQELVRHKEACLLAVVTSQGPVAVSRGGAGLSRGDRVVVVPARFELETPTGGGR